MAKHWVPGRVKTRLGTSIGSAHAAEIHRTFVTHLTSVLAAVADRRELVTTAPEKTARTGGSAIAGWTIVEQAEGDLGHRMERWFQTKLLDQPTTDAILIGADCPTVGPADVRLAQDSLGTAEVALGPAVDGGYWLIALRGPWRPAFADLFRSMTWSTDAVFRETRARAEAAQLSVGELERREDIDTERELTRLVDRLRERSGAGDRVAARLLQRVQRAWPDAHGDRGSGRIVSAPPRVSTPPNPGRL